MTEKDHSQHDTDVSFERELRASQRRDRLRISLIGAGLSAALVACVVMGTQRGGDFSQVARRSSESRQADRAPARAPNLPEPTARRSVKRTKRPTARPAVQEDSGREDIQLAAEKSGALELGEPPQASLPSVHASADAGTPFKETVAKMLQSHRGSIAGCYRREARIGAVDGKLDLFLVVEPDGEVAKAEVHTTDAKSRGMAECIVSQIRSWRFPAFPAEEAQAVQVPIVLETGAA